jgi:hypothetical protein
MRHLAFRMGDIVYRFDFFMWFYFTKLAVIILAITAGASWLFRSKRALLVVTACLMIVAGTYGLCEWTHLQHRMNCDGRFGQFQCDLSARPESAKNGDARFQY